jgi:HD-like signal output (HDOD) protein
MTLNATKPPIDRTHILKTAASAGVLGTVDAQRIMKALCKPEISAHQVAALVGGDPALSLRVLRVANSAYYRQPRSITTIERALALLGTDSMRGIAAAACLDRIAIRSKNVVVDMQALVRHSQATAAAAESLAMIRHPALASEAFIAGLLHNLGTAVQLALDPSGVESMAKSLAIDPAIDIRSLEARLVAVGHEECGAVIFEAWELPESLIAVARHHHDPSAAPDAHRDLAALIDLSATAAQVAGFTFTLGPVPSICKSSSMTRLGLNQDEVAAVADSLQERVAILTQALLAA